MKRVQRVNRSEVVRRRIREVIQQQARENKVKALLMSQELSRKPPEGYDGTKVIRLWRDRRYGPMRGRR